MPNKTKKAEINPVSIFATIGAILIALGVTWVFVSNWHQFNLALKILILLGSTAASFIAGVMLSSREYHKPAEGLYFLTTLLWTLSVFIIAQQFNYGNSGQETANLFFISTLGSFTIAYTMGSLPSLWVFLIMFYSWSLLQSYALTSFDLYSNPQVVPKGFWTFMTMNGLHALWVPIAYVLVSLYHRAKNSIDYANAYFRCALGLFLLWYFLFDSTYQSLFFDTQPLGYPPLLRSLGVALLIGAVGLYHRSIQQPDSAKEATLTAALVFLSISFSTTHQATQHFIGASISSLFSSGAIFYLILPLAVMGYALSQVEKKRSITTYDRYAEVAIFSIYFLLSLLLPLLLGNQTQLPGQDYSNYSRPIWDQGTGILLQWLIFNIVFIISILYICDFAAREERRSLMHLTLLFFGGYVIVRYAGFMMDLSGYFALSTLLIIGGIGLIGLSIGYQRFWVYTRTKASA